MTFFHAVIDHAVEWIDSIPVLVGLLLTVAELRNVQTAQRVGNQLKIVEHHRDIWSKLLDHPELARILDQNVNLIRKPVTNEESLFITFLILHLKGVLKAKGARMFIPPSSLERDIAWLFSLPIPHEVWRRSKNFQDPEVVEFVETALGTKSARNS